MRLQINFMLNGTKADPGGLFDHMQDDFIIPFVFVKRDSIMTNDQVSQILGDLITAGSFRMPILITLITLGVIFSIGGACCFRKYRDLKNEKLSYGHLERSGLIDEVKYKNGLSERKSVPNNLGMVNISD